MIASDEGVFLAEVWGGLAQELASAKQQLQEPELESYIATFFRQFKQLKTVDKAIRPKLYAANSSRL